MEQKRDNLDADIPSWEKVNAVRRDCESHRGTLISFCGRFSIALGVCGFCLLGTTSLVGLVLASAALWMSWRDLPLIEAGLMHPDGWDRTWDGLRCGLVGVLISLISGGTWAVLWTQDFR